MADNQNSLRQESKDYEWKKKHPWYERAVFYHIYPFGLCGVERANDGVDMIHRFDILNEYIEHMKYLGVSALYIGPLFESVGHGYETTDYLLVDKRLGDNEDFRAFVDECHKNEIKVVVDGVFNHTGRKFFAFLDVLKNRNHSRYTSWYCNVNFNANNEFNDGFSYEAWHGYNILPRLNLKNPEVVSYLLSVVDYWVKEFDIDGIRLDCADVLDFDFMKELRKKAEQIKADFWLMGEVIHGDYSRFVNRQMLHSVTNYELHKALYSGHNDFNYFEIAHTTRRLFDSNGGLVKKEFLYTFVENHDVDRLASKLKKKDNLFNVYLLAYTLPGIPSIYYGGEFGLEGKRINGCDDSIRPKIDLKTMLNMKEDSLYQYLCMLGEYKKKYEVLTYGTYREIYLTNRQYVFARILEKDLLVVAVNNDDSEVTCVVKTPVLVDSVVNLITKECYNVINGMLTIKILSHDGVLLSNRIS